MKNKLPNISIAFFVGALTAASLSLLNVSKAHIVGSIVVVLGSGLIIALKDEDDLNKKARDYEYFFNRAQDEFEVANYEKVILDYNKALGFDPLYIDGYFNRSSAKLKKGDFTGAIDHYTKVIQINPNDADAFFNRAYVKNKVEI